MESAVDFQALIHKYNQGSRRGYDEFVAALTSSSISDGYLLKCLTSVKDCVTLLDKRHESLVGILLNVPWATRTEEIATLYQSLMLNLVSVHTDYLKACLRMTIKNFFPDEDIRISGDGSIDMERNNLKFVRQHALLRTIARIVPMSPTLLMPLLTDMYPYLKKDVYIQECYVKNLFEITSYLPSLRRQILELIIDRMIKLDVRAPRAELLAAKKSEEEEDESDMFQMEDQPQVPQEADTLDVIILHVFHNIHDTCYSPEGELQWEATKRLYREMLLVFEKIILPTYACCHVQFVMFYLASLRSDICDGFLDYLWKLVQNPNVQAVYRQSAVAYMGSLLARGKFINIRTVKNTIDLMMKWVHNYTETCSDSVMADVTHHGPFYSVCQAVFYVFTFRQKEIFELKKGLKWAESLHFQHLVQCRLNPLKVCFPIIVKTFASVARQHQLAFCDHIIQQNNRSFLPVVSNGTQKILESYFPFDPYLLKRSSQFIHPVYREYERNLELDSDASENEEEDDDDEMFTEDIETAESSNVMAVTPGSLVDKATIDLMSYGTSPGFKHM